VQILFNETNDKFFMAFVKRGRLKVFKNGQVQNTKTGRFIGTRGSGGYVKISIPSHINPDYVKGISNRKWIIRHMQVHRLVYLVFKGPIPRGYYVDHINFNKLKNAVSNLQLLTPAENSKKSLKDGTTKILKGELNGNAILSNIAAKAIRLMYNIRMYTSRKLAAMYNVNRWVIYSIVKNRSYVGL
jgi:hypothetical protein